MNQERIYKVLLGRACRKKRLWRQAWPGGVPIAPDATKPEIKAVEQLFNVTVEGVQVLNRKGKLKRTIRGFGKRDDIRKAYVKLAEGQDLDFLDVE